MDIKLKLDSVTLCVVSTDKLMLSLNAIERSTRWITFKQILLFTPISDPCSISSEITVVNIPKFESIRDYNKFVLHNLAEHSNGTHILINQWDGFVINPKQWNDYFLNYDYIGAPWPQFPMEIGVGNGGFSLRSTKLLNAILDQDFVISHPEDLCICHTNRKLLEQKYNIVFAPIEIARQFSYERDYTCKNTFGFHGFFNFGDVFSIEEITEIARLLDHSSAKGADTKDLITNLIMLNKPEVNQAIFHLLCKTRLSYYFKPKILNYIVKNPAIICNVLTTFLKRRHV